MSSNIADFWEKTRKMDSLQKLNLLAEELEQFETRLEQCEMSEIESVTKELFMFLNELKNHKDMVGEYEKYTKLFCLAFEHIAQYPLQLASFISPLLSHVKMMRDKKSMGKH